MNVNTLVGALAAVINVLVIFILNGINRRLERIEDQIYHGPEHRSRKREALPT